MAKAKLKAKTGSRPVDPGKQAGKSIMETAQQIWLAGLGAFSRAQDEGSKLFEALIREGSHLEHKTRHLATGKVDEVRSAVETGVTQVRERTQETWDKLEQVFEKRVSHALGKLGVPRRAELDDLARRVEELTRQLRRANLGKSAAPAGATRRPRDELGDLVKDVEEAQIAERENARNGAAKAARGARSKSGRKKR